MMRTANGSLPGTLIKTGWREFGLLLPLWALLSVSALAQEPLKPGIITDKALVKSNTISFINKYEVLDTGKVLKQKIAYDADGNLKEIITYGPEGHNSILSYEYDEQGRLSALKAFEQAKGEKPKFKRKEVYRYDAKGNKSETMLSLTETGDSGIKTSYTYDSKNRLAEEYTEVLGTRTREVHLYEEDKEGRLITYSKTRIFYQPASDYSPMKADTTLELEESYVYANGKLKIMTRKEYLEGYAPGSGEIITVYEYNASGQLIKQSGQEAMCPDTFYEYDMKGRLVKTYRSCEKTARVLKYDVSGIIAGEGWEPIKGTKPEGSVKYVAVYIFEVVKH
ncbi:MAG: RHS repeat domain-containing protein [Bacteroidota bacterium]